MARSIVCEANRVTVMRKPKLVFLSNIASPYQVKFCYALQEQFDAEFWFYEAVSSMRPDWWRIPLGDRCRILRGTSFSKRTNYITLDVFVQLARFRPDVLLLGGFTPYHAIVLHVAKTFGIKVVILSEPIRNVSGEASADDRLLVRQDDPKKTALFYRLFKRADLLFGMGEVAARQFTEEFGFPQDKVVDAPYPMDIEAHFAHPLRQKRPGDPIRLLFANRLVARYGPLVALEAYKRLKRDYPNLSIQLNRDGEMAEACRSYILREGLTDVTFLDAITSWDDLHHVYAGCDILVLPATYSNGNLTIVEACASGMGLVVSHPVNNVDAHLHDDVNCFKCDPTVDSLEAMIRRYLDEPFLLEMHGARSKQYAERYRNVYTATVYERLLRESNLVATSS